MFKVLASFFIGIATFISGVGTNVHSVIKDTIASPTPTSQQIPLTSEQVQKLGSNKYADGNLPLGDNKYSTSGPKKGYIYLCNVQANSKAGAEHTGPWIHGNTWNIKEKSKVQGSVTWSNARFSVTTKNGTRTLSGNDLPSHPTGTFPIKLTDPASAYDKNPNSIKEQSFTNTFPVTPTYSNTPYCMGGEAGIMLTGVALFNGFDAGYRDAAAYEVQDGCQGHPQVTGEYHYHNLSSCITDVSNTTVIGYALDGYPITGPKVSTDSYLTTDDLDECHGMTSQIMLDGKMTNSYHYVMTQDFPYSVSCFRSKPVNLQVISDHGKGGQGGMAGQGGQNGNNNTMNTNGQSNAQGNNQGQQPPQEAITACSGKSSGTSCTFTTPRGSITGSCQTPSGRDSAICVPTNAPQH